MKERAVSLCFHKAPTSKASPYNTERAGSYDFTFQHPLQGCGRNGITDVGRAQLSIWEWKDETGNTTVQKMMKFHYVILVWLTQDWWIPDTTQQGGTGGLWQQLSNGWVETEENMAWEKCNYCLKKKNLNVLELLHSISIVFFFLIFFSTVYFCKFLDCVVS